MKKLYNCDHDRYTCTLSDYALKHKSENYDGLVLPSSCRLIMSICSITMSTRNIATYISKCDIAILIRFQIIVLLHSVTNMRKKELKTFICACVFVS